MLLAEKMHELAALAIISIPAVLHAIVAEVTGVVMPEWIGSLTQVSAFGLVAWIVYYMFSTWLPNIQKAHTEQMCQQRDAHVEAMRAMASNHAQAIERITAAYSETLKTQRADLLALKFSCRLPDQK